jgi:succinate dehydrogenase/fumarate reductase-like Fe-S protein
MQRIARLRIRRGTGDRTPGAAAHYDEFAVPFEEGATVLDALIRIRAEQDPSLAIRYSCINANVCKECTIAIDGRVGYACTTRLRGGAVTTLDPLPGKTVLRDLVTDMRPPRERLG